MKDREIRRRKGGDQIICTCNKGEGDPSSLLSALSFLRLLVDGLELRTKRALHLHLQLRALSPDWAQYTLYRDHGYGLYTLSAVCIYRHVEIKSCGTHYKKCGDL